MLIFADSTWYDGPGWAVGFGILGLLFVGVPLLIWMIVKLLNDRADRD